MEVHTFTSEFSVGFLVAPDGVLCFLTSTEVCSHWRVMGDLFREKLHVFIYKFICLSKEWIKWLCAIPFANGQLGSCIHSHKCQSFALVINLNSVFNYMVILHRLSTFLEQRCRVIKVNWDRKFRDIFAYWVLYNRPDTHFDIWVFKPRQFISFFWLHRYYFCLLLTVLLCNSLYFWFLFKTSYWVLRLR